MLKQIIDELDHWTLRTNNENNLQADVATVLADIGIEFEREVALSARDRIDFLCGDLGIECKIGGACAEVLRQMSRSAQSDRVSSLLLITRKASHRRIDGVVLNGKTTNVFWLNDL